MKMTLERFRKNTGLVTWAKAVLESAEWGLLMEAMEEAHARHARPDPRSYSDVTVSILLGRIHGYDEALNNLRCAGILIEDQELPEPTFAVEQTQPDKPKETK